jgi:hypothetical protein
MRHKLFQSLTVASLAVGASSLPILADSHTFKLSIAGITAGSIKLNATDTGSTYSAKGGLFPSGLVAKFATIGFDGNVSGRVKGKTYLPKTYKGASKSKSGTAQVHMTYSNANPKVISDTSTKAKPQSPPTKAQKKGGLDVITTTHILFQDRADEDLCKQTIPIFDGRKTSKITINKRTLKGGNVQCSGSYKRVQGFSTSQMAKGSNFPFTMIYEKQGDGMYRLMEFSTKTTFGRARAKRK